MHLARTSGYLGSPYLARTSFLEEEENSINVNVHVVERTPRLFSVVTVDITLTIKANIINHESQTGITSSL